MSESIDQSRENHL